MLLCNEMSMFRLSSSLRGGCRTCSCFITLGSDQTQPNGIDLALRRGVRAQRLQRCLGQVREYRKWPVGSTTDYEVKDHDRLHKAERQKGGTCSVLPMVARGTF